MMYYLGDGQTIGKFLLNLKIKETKNPADINPKENDPAIIPIIHSGKFLSEQITKNIPIFSLEDNIINSCF